MVKAVVYHKELKQELYRATQVVDIANKLILMISVFFLVSSVFQAVIQSPPSIAVMSAISLSEQDMVVGGDNLIWAVLVYLMLTLNTLYGTVIGSIGILQKSKLNIEIANFSVKHLTFAPFILGLLMIINGTCNLMFLLKTFDAHASTVSDSNRQLSIVIVVFLTLISAGAQVCFGLVVRRCHAQFRDSLEIYVFFMLKFQETPRSKVAKKYLPPMDVLREETASNYAETVNSGSVRHMSDTQDHLFRNTSKFEIERKVNEVDLVIEDPVAEENDVSMNSGYTGNKDSMLLKNINYSGKMHLQSVLNSSSASLT
jgi:hypothetical protein